MEHQLWTPRGLTGLQKAHFSHGMWSVLRFGYLMMWELASAIYGTPPMMRSIRRDETRGAIGPLTKLRVQPRRRKASMFRQRVLRRCNRVLERFKILEFKQQRICQELAQRACQ